MDTYKFHGVDTVEMAKKYGTPLYLMSEDEIRDRCREVRESFLDKYENTEAVYASKAFLTMEMARIIQSEGLGMDAVSGGEIYTMLRAGFPMEKVIFHGNNKLLDEIELAIESKVGRIVIDNLDEVEIIDQIAREHKRVQKVLVRVSPGIESDTHKYIQTAQLDSKFGVPLKDHIIDDLVARLEKSKNLDFQGFHFHIGSQLLKNDTHLRAVDIIFNLIAYVKDKFGLEVKELNTGGGYGIKYTDEDPRELAYFIDSIMAEITKKSQEYSMARPRVLIEPGRWIVGEAGMTIYQIGAVKEIPGVRTYASIDGGMTDNIRPSLYQAHYQALVLNKYRQPKTETVTIAGKCCESGDILIWDLKVPPIKRGDYLGVFSTGAYNYSMFSNYNKITRPALVMIKDGQDRIVVRRQSYRDLLEGQV